MSTVQHVDTPISVARRRDNVAVGDEIVRHRLATRLIHWSVALTFFIGLFSGMPIWTPIFSWMAVFFGGLETARVIHPWAGLLFFVASIFQFVHWLPDMHLHEDQKGWLGRKVFSYMRWEHVEESGKYNGGQILFFWAVSIGAIGFLLTGIPMWFPLQFPVWLREICILIHDITAICFIVAVIGHIYLGTAAEPGTFRAMISGTVTRRWAKFHHPFWYREVTGEEKRK